MRTDSESYLILCCMALHHPSSWVCSCISVPHTLQTSQSTFLSPSIAWGRPGGSGGLPVAVHSGWQGGKVAPLYARVPGAANRSQQESYEAPAAPWMGGPGEGRSFGALSPSVCIRYWGGMNSDLLLYCRPNWSCVRCCQVLVSITSRGRSTAQSQRGRHWGRLAGEKGTPLSLQARPFLHWLTLIPLFVIVASLHRWASQINHSQIMQLQPGPVRSHSHCSAQLSSVPGLCGHQVCGAIPSPAGISLHGPGRGWTQGR